MSEVLGADVFLESRPRWARAKDERDAVSRQFNFADFKTAWAFMSAVALKAEQMDHHPEWSNVYSTVDVLLTTHDAGGVTQKDLDLATFMDELASRLMD
ncbi:MAG: 4a-hydroxytetrahydrobiopterin dehydratase [Pseudomonadota bacterium]